MSKHLQTPDHTGETDINILLAMRTWIPKGITRQRKNILTLERKLVEARAELEELIKHAAVARIAIPQEGDEAPVLPEMSPVQVADLDSTHPSV